VIESCEQIITEFRVWSIEDGLAEGDGDGWAAMTAGPRERVQIVGDDLLVTNRALITDAIGKHAALIRLDQACAVTEALQAAAICRTAGWAQMVRRDRLHVAACEGRPVCWPVSG
jgi:enolase